MMPPRLVRDLMQQPVVTAAPHTPLPALKALMCQRGMHRLPIVENGRLVGIVTLGDVRNAFPSDIAAFNQRPAVPLERIKARDIMRTDVLTTTPDEPIAHAAQTLLRHKISGLPVVDGERVVGMFTKSDLCRLIAAEAPGEPSRTMEPTAAYMEHAL